MGQGRHGGKVEDGQRVDDTTMQIELMHVKKSLVHVLEIKELVKLGLTINPVYRCRIRIMVNINVYKLAH